MKKILPYLLIGIILIAAIFLIFLGGGGSVKHRILDERMSFLKRDKIPYGTYVAFEGLKHLFPHASVYTDNKEPGYWESLSNYDSGQALIIVAPIFSADKFEMIKLLNFIDKGNDVFISSAFVSSEVKTMLNCDISFVNILELMSGDIGDEYDTLNVSLSNPPFKRSFLYHYPGRRLNCHFYKVDSSTTTKLGNDYEGNPNFVQLKAGKGHLYLHLAPMAFSNYFLLHERNRGYYEDILSVISPDTRTVVWDEYYLQKRSFERRFSQNRGGEWLSALFKHDSFKWALLTALLSLLVFVLLEMRRKQRFIPVIKKPRNDSLDFVKTIGRLYFDKGDHKNLCRKMSAYFLEHVRNRYKLATNVLNEDFIKNLQHKTGVDELEIRSIVFFVRDIDSADVINDHQLAYFHRQLESFYSKA